MTEFSRANAGETGGTVRLGYVDAEGVFDIRTAEARYPDQAWEIEVPLRTGRFDSAADVKALCADFHRVHEETFAVSDETSAISASNAAG